MKKTIFLLIMLTLTSSIYATQTRLAGLGITSWMIEKDDYSIWLNPADITDYPNYIWGELGQGSGSGLSPKVNGNLITGNKWGGVSYELSVGGLTSNLGLFVGRPYLGLLSIAGARAIGSDVDSVPTTPSNLTPLSPEGKLDIFCGFNLGSLRLGGAVLIASNYDTNEGSKLTKPNTTAGDTKYSQSLNSSDIWIMLGGKMLDIGPISSFDGVLNLGLHSVNNTYKDEQYSGTRFVTNNDYSFKTTGGMDYELTLRSTMKLSDKTSFIGVLDYFGSDVSNECLIKTDSNLNGTLSPADGDTNYKRVQEFKVSNFLLGAAANIYPSKKLLIILGTNFNYRTQKQVESRTQQFSSRSGIDQEFSREASYITVPFHISFEYYVSKVLTVRNGINKVIRGTHSLKVTDPDYGAWNGSTFPLSALNEYTEIKDDTGSYSTNVSLGMGVNITKNLSLDVVVRQDVMFTGTYIISGVPETLVSQISTIYKF